MNVCSARARVFTFAVTGEADGELLQPRQERRQPLRGAGNLLARANDYLAALGVHFAVVIATVDHDLL